MVKPVLGLIGMALMGLAWTNHTMAKNIDFVALEKHKAGIQNNISSCLNDGIKSMRFSSRAFEYGVSGDVTFLFYQAQNQTWQVKLLKSSLPEAIAKQDTSNMTEEELSAWRSKIGNYRGLDREAQHSARRVFYGCARQHWDGKTQITRSWKSTIKFDLR